ncbi:MAG: hypothetical protein RBS89_07955 [Candidatus Delongbacteria bacterium]|jgi:hypothetical protein|nr:hypothetical protein [Candidatus Delongbacteria bacterium]
MKLYHFIILALAVLLNGVVDIGRSDNELTLKLTEGDNYSVMSFRKTSEDSVFNFLKYSKNKKIISLSEECGIMDVLWSEVDEETGILLNTADIGYPLQFPDIMPDYIQAFLDSEEWMTHVSLKGKELNYELMHSVIYSSNVFQPLTDLLYLHGYYITGVSTEKHGFVPKQDLINFGYKGDEIIPVPFMLYWKVERVKKVK